MFFEEIAQLNYSTSLIIFHQFFVVAIFRSNFFFAVPPLGSCSEYLFNDKSVSRSAYISELEKVGILVKARNCLVFQVSI